MHAASAPGLGVANVWVDTDGGSCIRKATAATYVSADACRSFQAAWSAMASGDTARVRPGTYGQQVITGNKTAPTFIIGDAGVTISGSTPASCGYQNGLVCANANFLNLNNVTVNSGSTHGQSSGSEINGTNVTFDHVNLHGSFVSLYPRGQNFTWRVGSLGQDGVAGGQRSCNTGDGEPVWIESSAAGATLDQIRFNSMSASGAACSGSVDGFHLEYVRVQATQNVTISNSVFVDDGGTGNGAGSGKIFITSSSSSGSAANGLQAARQHVRIGQGKLRDPDPRQRPERKRLADQEQRVRAARSEPEPTGRRRVRQHRPRQRVLEDGLLDGHCR